jgi:hypothetical protein
MTAGGSGSAWLGHSASRWGHFGSAGLTISVFATIILVLRPPAATGSSALIAPAIILAFALISWRAMRQHDRRLCEACARSMPLNMAEVAARYRLRFVVAHAVSVKWAAFSYLALLVGSDLVLLPGAVNERLAWAAIQSTMVYLVLAYSSHRRFQPWCPQCRGGHGERDDSNDRGPVPLNDHSR